MPQGKDWKYEIPFGGAVNEVVRLRAASSAVLNLRADPASLVGSQDYSEVVWDPKPHRVAQPIELRARHVAVVGDLNTHAFPLVFWRIKFGHGTAAWNLPIPTTPGLVRASTDYTVPGRGLFFRTMAREFRIQFRNGGSATNTGSLENIQLQVTINPAQDTSFSLPVYTQTHLNVVDANTRYDFPIEAREWRLLNRLGLPVTEPGEVYLYSMTGTLSGFQPVASYSDWQPIPEQAAQWRLDDVFPTYCNGYYR